MAIPPPRSNGSRAAGPRLRADYIAVKDIPGGWRTRAVTIDVEAKELAVIALRDAWPSAERSKPRGRDRTRVGSPTAREAR